MKTIGHIMNISDISQHITKIISNSESPYFSTSKKSYEAHLNFESNRGEVIFIAHKKRHAKRYFIECQAALCGGLTVHSLPGTD